MVHINRGVNIQTFDTYSEGSEVIILENINDDTSLDACKGPPTLEEGGNTAAESSPKSDIAGSKSKNDCAK